MSPSVNVTSVPVAIFEQVPFHPGDVMRFEDEAGNLVKVIRCESEPIRLEDQFEFQFSFVEDPEAQATIKVVERPLDA